MGQSCFPLASARPPSTAQGSGAPWTGDVAQWEHLYSTFEVLDLIPSIIKQANKQNDEKHSKAVHGSPCLESQNSGGYSTDIESQSSRNYLVSPLSQKS